MKLLLVGATGLVGSHVLALALADDRVSSVVAPVRHALHQHPKLLAPIINYEELPEEAEWWQADAVICTLGTTIRKAGSQQAFCRVDYDYPLAIAQLALRYGTTTYVLNSAMGANATSRIFYSRTKGELEEVLKQQKFCSLTLVQPGMIDGNRQEFRLSERILVSGLKLFAPLLPKCWHVNPAEKVAQILLEAAVDSSVGVQVITSESLIVDK